MKFLGMLHYDFFYVLLVRHLVNQRLEVYSDCDCPNTKSPRFAFRAFAKGTCTDRFESSLTALERNSWVKEIVAN